MLNSLQFDMQHDYFQKKWFDLLTPTQGQGCVCWQSICYHVAACVGSFDMQHYHIPKKLNFGIGPPLIHPRGLDSGLQTNILYDMFHIYCSSAYMQNFSKNIGHCLCYCKRGTCIKGLFWPPLEPKTESCFTSISSYWFVRRIAQV